MQPTKGGNKRTCGSGVNASHSGCEWAFGDLDVPFKLSSMHAEKVADPLGDGLLTADELWTPRCNLVLDFLVIGDLDPHVMLVVFLPARPHPHPHPHPNPHPDLTLTSPSP
jgi:hypothetical protein